VLKAFATGLAYFGDVARLRSVRRAAERLRIAPSALSRQIRQIEERLGLPLFERAPRGLHLTAAGEILFAYLQRWEKDFGALSDDLQGLAGLRLGTLRLATVEVATYGVVPRAIRALHDKMPGMTVQMKVGVTDAILRDVAEGRAEIGIVINMPRAPGVKSAWDVRTTVGAVVPPGHELAGRREASFADCLAYPVVMPDEDLIVHYAIRRALARTTRAACIAATSDRIASIKALVKAGVGLSFLVELDVAPEIETGELCFIKLKDRDIEPPHISLVVPKRSKPSPAALTLLALLQRELMPDGKKPGKR
jgi:DNA-binding transcriptional LysR family regulator